MKLQLNHFKTVFISLMIACVLIIFSMIIYYYHSELNKPIVLKDFDIILHQGESVKSFANKLKRHDVIKGAKMFVILSRLHGASNKLKAGDYQLIKGMSTRQVLSRLVTGRMLMSQFTVIEGWTFQQLKEALNQVTNLRHDSKQLSDAEIMEKLGEKNVNPEGEFFPETYKYASNVSDFVILKMAHRMMNLNLSREWKDRDANIIYSTPYQALIAASLIEKEASNTCERSIISGIVINRLNKKMPLQLDASIIYGLKDNYKGKLTTKNMRTNTPYNSYLNRGLPPTPIAMPSLSSIQAALHPIYSDLLFYVSMNDGKHSFSSNLKRHNVKVKRFQINNKT